jgi:hypothetical protein
MDVREEAAVDHLHLSGPGPWTLDLYPPIPPVPRAAGPFRSDHHPEPGAVSRRHPSQHAARGGLAVRHDVPESADTESLRSDGRGIDLIDQKGVVVSMSDLRRSATQGPRLPVGTAGTDGRGGSRRGAG